MSTPLYVVYDETGEDVEDKVLRLAYHEGNINRWCEVVEFSPRRRLVLCRRDTDGMPLNVTLGRVRQAMRRASTKAPDRLGMTDFEAAAIRRVSEGEEPSGKVADWIVQIAATGRVMYT